VSVAPQRPLLPRAALLGLAVAAASHIAAIATALSGVQVIPAWHWGLLLCSDALLALVVVSRAEWFLTRNFRLPGIFVLTTSVIILAPLPAAVRMYRQAVPHETVLSIALGIAVFAALAYILTSSAPAGRPITAGPSETVIPWAIVGVSLIIFPIWVRAIGSVPLVELFGTTDPLKAAGARARALESLNNAALRAAVGSIRNLYLMFAAGFLVSRAATTGREDWRRLTRWRLAAVGVLALAAVFALLTTERAILGELVIVCVVAWLVSRRRQLSARSLAISALIGLSFPLMYAIALGFGGSAAFDGLKRRIFFLPDDVMLHYFIHFPKFHAFLKGTSIPKWGRLTGSPTFDLSTLIYDKYYKVDPSQTGIANGSFIGVGWANWGLVGVVIWCAVAAVAVVGTERIVRSFPTTSSAALRGVAVVQTALLTSSDLSRSLLGFLPGFLDIPVMLWVARWIDQRFGRIPSRRPRQQEGAARSSSRASPSEFWSGRAR
jgi:hypothetical protein